MQIRKAIIPAAGLGTRLLPITKSIPKEMLPIAEKPTIQYIIEEVLASGINEILVIISSTKNAIVDYFDIDSNLENYLLKKKKNDEHEMIGKIGNMSNIYYVRQKSPLGLGDAILCAETFVGNEPFAVLSGDDVIFQKNNKIKPVLKQCIDIYEKFNGIVLGVQNVDKKFTNRYGIVKPGFLVAKNVYKVKDIVEKPKVDQAPSTIAVMGRYILNSSIFTALRQLKKKICNTNAELELTDAIKILIKKEKVFAKIFEGQRFDIGSRLGLLEANIFESLFDKEDNYVAQVKEILKKYVKE